MPGCIQALLDGTLPDAGRLGRHPFTSWNCSLTYPPTITVKPTPRVTHQKSPRCRIGRPSLLTKICEWLTSQDNGGHTHDTKPLESRPPCVRKLKGLTLPRTYPRGDHFDGFCQQGRRMGIKKRGKVRPSPFPNAHGTTRNAMTKTPFTG